VRAYKTYKNSTCLKQYPGYQAAIIALYIKNKQAIAYGIHTVKTLFHISKKMFM